MKSIVNFDPRISLLILTLSSFFLALLPVQVGAETSWDWDNGTKLEFKTRTSLMPLDRCFYTNQVIKTSLIGDYKNSCFSSGSKIRFGHYWNGNYYQNIISTGVDEIAYRLFNACQQPKDCKYLPNSDTLVVKRFSIIDQKYVLMVFGKFSNRITLKVDSNVTNPFFYEFNDSSPDFILRSSDGIGLLTGGINVSANEKFLAFELMDHGYGVLDLSNFSYKRITASSQKYNQGSNPSVELDISNSGQDLIISGLNAGFRMINISAECGDYPDYYHYVNDIKPIIECHEVFSIIDNYIEHFMNGYKPRFNNDGGSFTLFAWTYTGNGYYLKISASNYYQQKMDYISMGDSFSSGEGDTNQAYYLPYTNTANEQCHTSTRSYPYLLSDKMFIDPLKMISVACSGAQTIDIYGDKDNYKGQGDRLSNHQPGEMEVLKLEALTNNIPGRIHQEEFIRQYQPKIATIGIGGNDIDLVGKLRDCILNGTCDYALSIEEKNHTANEIKNLFNKLVNTYESLHSASPATKLYAIGYPKIIKPGGGCGIITDSMLNETERQFADETIMYINNVIEAAAKRVGIKYLDIENSFNGSALCDKEPQAMNAVRISGENHIFGDMQIQFPKIDAESFHPTEFGHELTANLIHGTTGSLLYYQYCSNGGVICPDSSIQAPNPSPYWETDTQYDNYRRLFVNMMKINNRTIEINLPQYTFLPNSLVNLEVHSTKLEIGTFTADANGSLNLVFDLPDNFEYGFHSVHAIGSTYSEENIDIYQSFQYAKPQEAEVIVNNTTVTPVITNNTPTTTNTSNNQPNTVTAIETNNQQPIDNGYILGESTEKIPEQTAQAKNLASIIKKNADNQNQISNLPIIAVVIIIASSLIFLRYLFFSSKTKIK